MSWCLFDVCVFLVVIIDLICWLCFVVHYVDSVFALVVCFAFVYVCVAFYYSALITYVLWLNHVYYLICVLFYWFWGVWCFVICCVWVGLLLCFLSRLDLGYFSCLLCYVLDFLCCLYCMRLVFMMTDYTLYWLR